MMPDDIVEALGPKGELRLEQGRILSHLIQNYQLHDCIAVCNTPSILPLFISGAISLLGRGLLRTVISGSSKDHRFDLQGSANKLGLSSWISVSHDLNPETWQLMTFLRAELFERFDFVLIDGYRNWSEAGFMFCLAERLVRPGGWIALGNLNFTFRQSGMKDRPWVLSKSEDEQVIPQIDLVFELLMKRNFCFDNFRRMDSLGLARRRMSTCTNANQCANETERAICKAVERAARDPDFREALLYSPGQISSLFTQESSKVVFLEATCTGPIAQCLDENGSIFVYLDRPAWHNSVDEASLERMLKDATKLYG